MTGCRPEVRAEAPSPAGPVASPSNEDTQLQHTSRCEDQPKFKKLESTREERQSGTLEVGPGYVHLFCDVPGHRPAGMEATLKVG